MQEQVKVIECDSRAFRNRTPEIVKASRKIKDSIVAEHCLCSTIGYMPLGALFTTGLLTAPIFLITGPFTIALTGSCRSFSRRCSSRALSSAICVSISIRLLYSTSVMRLSLAEYPFSFSE